MSSATNSEYVVDAAKSAEDIGSVDSDVAQLAKFGYTQVLHRSWGQFSNFAASFCALYFVGGIRYLFSVGISAGGAPALWSSWLITVPFMCITAAMLAEVCSSLPLSGSIYVWAAESAGPKWGRLAGFIVAYWSTTAWTSFIAGACQGTMNYMLSELVIFGNYPGGIDESKIKFRVIVWAGSEALLAVAVFLCTLPPRVYRSVFVVAAVVQILDFFLTFVWLPIGVSKTYGFQDRAFFTEYYNGTGASTGWNWILSFLFTSGVLTGFDASGHIAEETKNASITAARGMFWSCVASGVLGTPILLLFLACSPNLDVLFSYSAPQPFVVLYNEALGRGGQVVMTVVAVLGLLLNIAVCIVAASRLAFAIARDGVLPGSSWIGKTDKHGGPRNAVIFIGSVGAFLLCFVLASPVAFTSLISGGAIPTIAAYALIPALRLLCTPNQFKDAKWSLGKLSMPFCYIAIVWNLFLMSVLASPYYFPVTADNFNFAPVILAVVTFMGIVSYWVIPEEKWLSSRHLKVIAANEVHAKTV